MFSKEQSQISSLIELDKQLLERLFNASTVVSFSKTNKQKIILFGLDPSQSFERRQNRSMVLLAQFHPPSNSFSSRGTPSGVDLTLCIYKIHMHLRAQIRNSRRKKKSFLTKLLNTPKCIALIRITVCGLCAGKIKVCMCGERKIFFLSFLCSSKHALLLKHFMN